MTKARDCECSIALNFGFWLQGTYYTSTRPSITALYTRVIKGVDGNWNSHKNGIFQWRRQLRGTGERAPLTSNNFIFSSLWSKSESQLSKYCVIGEINWCRCQQLTALSISTALVTKLLVIEQLLHLAVKSTVSAPWQISIFAPPRNKSWRRHCTFFGFYVF